MAARLLVRSGGGETGASLTVYAPVGASVSLTMGEESLSGTISSKGNAVFQGLSTGSWHVSVSKDGQSAQQDVAITADYSVTYPAGSTCTCTKGTTVLKASGTSGTAAFTVPEAGSWVVSCTNGAETASTTVTISADGEEKSVSLGYQLYPADFNLSGYGTMGTDYQVVYDDDTEIPEAQWSSAGSWKIRLLTSGALQVLKDGQVDVFAVGGGGGSISVVDGKHDSYTGGPGYAVMEAGVGVSIGSYPVTIGAGGSGGTDSGSSGGITSAFGLTANGGSGANAYGNGAGGTAIGEFGADSLHTYCQISTSSTDAAANTGDGGGKAGKYVYYAGGSGIVIIRNARG